MTLKGALDAFIAKVKGVVLKKYIGGCAPKPLSLSPNRN